MNHCPCEGCKNSVGGVECRLNVENECKQGGGFEMWEPIEIKTMPDNTYVCQLEANNEYLLEAVKKLRRENRMLKQGETKKDKIFKWASIFLVWTAYPLIIYKLCLELFGR